MCVCAYVRYIGTVSHELGVMAGENLLVGPNDK